MSKKKKETRNQRKPHKEKKQTARHRQAILDMLDANARKGLTLTQIVRKLAAKKKEDLKRIERFIASLLASDRIRQLKNGHYVSNRKEEEYIGVVDHVSSRFAYVDIGDDHD